MSYLQENRTVTLRDGRVVTIYTNSIGLTNVMCNGIRMVSGQDYRVEGNTVVIFDDGWPIRVPLQHQLEIGTTGVNVDQGLNLDYQRSPVIGPGHDTHMLNVQPSDSCPTTDPTDTLFHKKLRNNSEELSEEVPEDYDEILKENKELESENVKLRKKIKELKSRMNEILWQ